MELDNTFAVTAPIERVWSTLMDVDQVARCVPGAQVLGKLSEDAYKVAMRVKLGPVTMQYRGQVDVLERDEDGRRAVMRGKAKESRGQGTADANVEMRLTQDGEQTRGTVHADVRLSGRAAAMGQGVIGTVADQMLAQFAHNLEAMLNEPQPQSGTSVGADGTGVSAVDAMGKPAQADRSGPTVVEGVETLAGGTQSAGVQRPPESAKPRSAPVEQVKDDPDMTQGRVAAGPGEAGGPRPDVPSGRMPEAPVSGGAQSMPGGRVSDRVSASGQRPSAAAEGSRDRAGDDGGSLDGLALARSVLTAQLRQPRALAGLVAVLALAAFRLGRRSGRRSSRGFERLRMEDLERFADMLLARRGTEFRAARGAVK